MLLLLNPLVPWLSGSAGSSANTHTARDNAEDTEVVLSCLHTDMRESQEPYSWFEKCLLYASRSNSQS